MITNLHVILYTLIVLQKKKKDILCDKSIFCTQIVFNFVVTVSEAWKIEIMLFLEFGLFLKKKLILLLWQEGIFDDIHYPILLNHLISYQLSDERNPVDCHSFFRESKFLKDNFFSKIISSN